MLNKPIPKRDNLDKLIKEAAEVFSKLSPEQKKEVLRQQRISWVYGNLSLDNPDITREMVEKAAEEWL